jgi:hypothetical protein
MIPEVVAMETATVGAEPSVAATELMEGIAPELGAVVALRLGWRRKSMRT